MDRRTFLAIAGGLLAAPLAAEAQQVGKVARVGYLDLTRNEFFEAFKQQLRGLGWIEGQNLAIEYRLADRAEQLTDLAAELARLNVDVILPGGGPATLRAVRGATKTIPIVMVASTNDPIRDGLITSFAHPGGNITGIVSSPEELLGKRFELLKGAVTGLSRVGFLWDSTLPVDLVRRLRKQSEEIAQSLHLEVLHFEAREAADFDSVVSGAARERVGGLMVVGTPLFVENRSKLAELLTRHRLPAMSQWRSFAEAGLLMTYGFSLLEQFRRAAAFVDKILRGAKAADLPVEQQTKVELVINLKTAKALGLTIPPSLLQRADQVIE
jgi:putative tryptophan/tyrosine transport system substrate-binding protein